MNIGGSFTVAFSDGDIQEQDSFTLVLDSIITGNDASNITSRLVTNISNLISGDRIECAAINMQDAITLNYRLRGNLSNFNLYSNNNKHAPIQIAH